MLQELVYGAFVFLIGSSCYNIGWAAREAKYRKDGK